MKRLLFLFILIFSLPVRAADMLVVRAHTLVQNNSDIYLSDIVELDGLSDSIQKSMKAVKLANGPRLGERQVLSSDSISRLIRKHISRLKLHKKLRLKIPNQVIVENQGFSLQSKEVEKQLIRHWKSFCKKCVYQISQLNLPKVKAQVSPMDWKLIFDGKSPRGQFSYQIKKDSKIMGWVQGMVRVFDQVPVASRAIHFGERLNADDFQLAKKDVTYSHDSPAKEKFLVGRKLNRALRAGDIIWTNSLEKIWAAKRGQPVKVVIGSDEWQLSIQGVAQMDGQLGDTISVKNPSSDKMLSGILVKNREVQVQ